MSEELKKCSKCGSTKLLETYFSKNVKGQRYKTCDSCRERVKQYRIDNKDKLKKQAKQYYEANKEMLNKAHKEWLSKNKESQYQKHKENRKAGKHNCIHNIRKDTCRVCNPNSYLKKIVSKRIWEALKSNKLKKSLEYLGCDIATFREHLEKSFKTGMTWENQGKYGWDIDHIIPVLYKQDGIEPSIEEVGKRLHYTNCQAMWHTENMKKGNRYCGAYQSESDSDI